MSVCFPVQVVSLVVLYQLCFYIDELPFGGAAARSRPASTMPSLSSSSMPARPKSTMPSLSSKTFFEQYSEPAASKAVSSSSSASQMRPPSTMPSLSSETYFAQTSHASTNLRRHHHRQVPSVLRLLSYMHAVRASHHNTAAGVAYRRHRR